MIESDHRFSYIKHRRIGNLARAVVLTLVVYSFSANVICLAAPEGGLAPAGNAEVGGKVAPVDLQNLPLRGLTGTTSLGVYPQLDKGLLVTPGPHPEKISTPLSTIVEGGAQLKGKVEGVASPRGKYQGLLIAVENHSDRPVIFDGDAASLKVGGAEVVSVPMSKLAELSVLPEQSKSFARRFGTDLQATTTAALTVGWVPTIRDQKRGSGPIVGDNGGRYGLDEQRRTDQLRRFGKRVLWPGETTSGVLYFDSRAQLSAVAVNMPVSSYHDQTDRAVLILSQ